jgi:hypothetical protein
MAIHAARICTFRWTSVRDDASVCARLATQFTVPVPPALTSALYTAEFEEVKRLGAIASPARTADQTLAARFWASASGPHYIWNTVARTLSEERHLTLSENARLLALMNVSLIDAFIAAWNGKKTHNFWRPITAIQLADTDGNPATSPDPWVRFRTADWRSSSQRRSRPDADCSSDQHDPQ